MKTAPRAAAAVFPYPGHRTIENIEIYGSKVEARIIGGEWFYKGKDWDEAAGCGKDLAKFSKTIAPKSTLPHTSCPNCGARGWCGHNGRVQQ